jgi:8-oxo-dGTP pyrophosphatase MutT (NUDIX family)/phosphohistidine phosphatase SixA
VSKKSEPVIAGGAVCWKRVDGEVRVLLVHRTQHKDVSLPKGKRDPGETVPECAQREILEETGLHITLGAYLGHVDYVLPSGKDKNVYYWAAEVDPGEAERTSFEANSEISKLEWVGLGEVHDRLSYPQDGDIIDRFQQLVQTSQERTFPLILVRHAKAMPPENWDGPDHTRPLLQRGLNQAKRIAKGIAAFGPQRIVSSPAVRCLATIDPLANVTGLGVKVKGGISQDAYRASGEKPRKAVGKEVAKREGSVLCSHGPVLPQLLTAAAERGNGESVAEFSNLGMSTGQFTVIHFSRDTATPRIVAVETHQAPED